MPKWKCGAIVFICLDIFFIWVTVDEYYEFFIKDCRDAFPFGYCPWGGESMGWAWRSADAYLNGLIGGGCILLLFLPSAIYFYYNKRFGLALCLALSSLVINCIWSWTKYFLYN